MKNGCFCAKGQKYQEKIIGFPIIQHYIIIAFDKKCNKNFCLSFWPLTLFSQTSFLLWMNLVSPRRVSLFPAFSSLPNPFPVKRLPEGPAPSTPLHLNGKAEHQGENQEPTGTMSSITRQFLTLTRPCQAAGMR